MTLVPTGKVSEIVAAVLRAGRARCVYCSETIGIGEALFSWYWPDSELRVRACVRCACELGVVAPTVA